MSLYQQTYQRWQQDPEAFWMEAAAALHWDSPFHQAREGNRWFPGGHFNTCYNALDRHVENGRAEQIALIYDSPLDHKQQKFTYRELLIKVACLAGKLQELGVRQGDRVLIYMPMVPETLMAMLACARLGAVHSVVFGGFASQELAARIHDAQPKLILTASCGLEPRRIVEYQPLLERALETNIPIMVLDRPQCAWHYRENHHRWGEGRAVAPARTLATDPLYILYTSGTTGIPKGIVRDHGGHAVALKWSMQHIYNISPGEVFWAASDMGWAVGHSYIVYGPLLHGCTTVLFEGKPVGTPDAGEFWRVIEEHRVVSLFTAPTAFRAIKKEDPQGTFLKRRDLTNFRALFLAGERLDPDTYHWASQLLEKPVVDHWWQTETGWPVASTCLGLDEEPGQPGSPGKTVPGYRVEILDERGQALPAGQEGAVALKLPLPPGNSPTLWNQDEKYHQVYLSQFPGYYNTGDGGYLGEDGHLFIMGRLDDVIIVAGHNLSTGSLEEALAGHPAVAECAVFAVKDDFKGQLPLGMVVLKAGQPETPQLHQELVQRVRDGVGAIACLKQVVVVERLPKTRSGKILRAALRKLADGVEFPIPPTIEDASVLDELRERLKSYSRR
ncbi:MAG: AMP-binding protein [Candidatus Eremiobacteraeota bacterium]|nr:AMP-binding protein [Candidatus Eremiobacteraeota bacterium]MCW5872397.1 AMP-binding protein [Candidatus Eremiobacteraeota bacterium]